MSHSQGIHSREETKLMWDTVDTGGTHLSHDMPCTGCGHGQHTYLPCSDTCACEHGRDRTPRLAVRH